MDTEYEACACSPLGKVKRVSPPYAPGGAVYWTTYTYDVLGRTLTVTAPDGASTATYEYAGNTTTVRDPTGKWKTFTRDVFGNLTRVTERNPAGGNFETTYTYNAFNQLTQVSMPRNGTTQTRTFVYDDRGRLISATNPDFPGDGFPRGISSDFLGDGFPRGRTGRYPSHGRQRAPDVQLLQRRPDHRQAPAGGPLRRLDHPERHLGVQLHAPRSQYSIPSLSAAG